MSPFQRYARLSNGSSANKQMGTRKGSNRLMNPRQLAVSLLVRVEQEDSHAQDLLDRTLVNPQITGPDRGLLAELVYGSIRHRFTLDSILERFSRTRLERLDYPVLEILRTALYQIVFLDRIPPAAAVNEAVNLARPFHLRSASTFINAVLRNTVRAIEDRVAPKPSSPTRSVYRRPDSWCVFRTDIFPSPDKSPAEFIARAYSHPVWLVERWLQRFGPEQTTAFCRAGNAIPQITIRINILKISAFELLRRFTQGGIKAEPAELPIAIRLPGHIRVDQLPGFTEGLFVVQDVTAMQVAPFLDPKPGQRVLDLCAAPGGKTTHLAELMHDVGEIVAVDISRERLKFVEENCQRLNLTCVKTLCLDATNEEMVKGALQGGFDAVLLDVPCSNTGVLARRPEARWRLSPQSIAECATRQALLLRTALGLLKPAGRLVYSTCSIEPEENEQLVRAVLTELPHFELQDEKYFFPSASSSGGYMARITQRTTL